MNENRADNFLRLIRRAQRGKLKIYLGYAAGVGKTCQMLQEGHRMIEDQVDLVIGVVETHGRAATAALVEGLPVVPCRSVTYRGIVIQEMDLDAILERNPDVVLVDELAHTNVPGSKHAKRYQDVEAILAAGIHVISTLNIQHLESLYETVERGMSVKVRERVPDRVVAEADQIVNVDVTIEDLRRRLKEGKIYGKERIETALANFFRPSNLEQLRELTLRELASQIDSRRRDPLDQDVPSSPDQVMVALSSRGPNSGALLRYASRLAGRLNRNWYAVYVQTSKELPTVIDAATQRVFANTLTLAQQLGATVFTYKGDDVAKTILQFAKEYRVGHIVIGSPGKKLSFWKRLLGESSIIERLVLEGNGVTVVVLDTKAIKDDPLSASLPEVSDHETQPTFSDNAPTDSASTHNTGVDSTSTDNAPTDNASEAPAPSEKATQSTPATPPTADTPETQETPAPISQPKNIIEASPPNDLKFGRVTAVLWKDPIYLEVAIRQLFATISELGAAHRARAVDAVLDDEGKGGTHVGADVELPHTRVPGLTQPIVAIGMGQNGIQDSATGRVTKIIILLLSPNEPPELHIQALGMVSKMATNDLWRQGVLSVTHVDELRQAVRLELEH